MHHFPAGRARELCQVRRQFAQGNNSSTNTALPRGRGKALTFSCWRSGAGVGGWVGSGILPLTRWVQHICPNSSVILAHHFLLPAPNTPGSITFTKGFTVCSLLWKLPPCLWEDVSCASQCIDEETAALRYYNLLQVAQEDKVNT